MNEIPRLYHNTMIPVSAPSQVTPARPTDTNPNRVKLEQERRGQSERRKKNKKPVIDRRVSSDRRGPRFEGKA
jgi:hypothetical protein